MNISEVANNIIGDKCNCQPDEGDCHWCIQRNGIEEALKTLESEKAALIKNNQDNLVQERKGWTDTVKAKDERIKGLEAMHGLDKVALDEALAENKALKDYNQNLSDELAEEVKENKALRSEVERLGSLRAMREMQEEISALRKSLENVRELESARYEQDILALRKCHFPRNWT
jgi:vacuolar-type H+-ATPase subunit I/STV1